MTNAEIKSRFAERLELTRATPRTRQSVPRDVYNRLTAYEVERIAWPRRTLAREIRDARKVKPVAPDAVQVIRHAAYEEDVRNEIYYGKGIAGQLRDAR